MGSAILQFIIQFILKGFGIGTKPEPISGDQVALQSEVQANEQLQKAAAALANANAERVRLDPESNVVHADPNASINHLPGENFRD